MDLTIALVTDLHFGPEARFAGKLRKLTAHAGDLARAFVERMNREIRPDLVVNLGDDIEDESPEADRARYAECQGILRSVSAELVNVAGNHDTIHLGAADLAAHPEPTIVLMHHSAADQDLSGNRWFEGLPHICLVRERRRIRALLEGHGDVRAVFNGHLHWNHLDVIGGLPYVTLQSLIENLDDDAPGRAAAAHAVVRLSPRRIVVEVEGAERARYQFDSRRE